MIVTNHLLDNLERLLSEKFTMMHEVNIGDVRVPLMAEASADWRYHVASKKIVLENFQTNEFLAIFPGIIPNDGELLKTQIAFSNFIKDKINHIPNHWRSRVLVIYISEQLPNFRDLQSKLRRYSRFWWIKWGWKGWYEILFACIAGVPLRTYIPRRGKEFKPLLERIAQCIESEEVR